LDKHYETLESKKSDDFDVIKKNYRRLIKQFHYDSIASKNLPDEMVKFAEQKTQDLNEAYAAIKEARG
jgi:DnaJ like chaperone protein